MTLTRERPGPLRSAGRPRPPQGGTGCRIDGMDRLSAVPPDGTGQPVVERLEEDQWRDLQKVRLAALAESPAAFGSRLEDEQAFDETGWRAWARSAAVFVARADGPPIGVAVVIDGNDLTARALVSVWVSPPWRGRGVAVVLMEAAERWARADGASLIRLWLTRGNDAARGLYVRRGYVATGRSKPLPSSPDLVEDEFVLDLNGPTHLS